MINRRQLLMSIGGAIAGTAAIVGTAQVTLNKQRRTELGKTFINKVVRAKFNYLSIDQDGLNQFSEDFLNTKGNKLAIKASIAGFFLQNKKDTALVKLLVGKSRYQQLEHEVGLKFLLSSDFFINGSDEKRTVHYLHLFDPFTAACQHPFAKYDFTTT